MIKKKNSGHIGNGCMLNIKTIFGGTIPFIISIDDLIKYRNKITTSRQYFIGTSMQNQKQEAYR